MRGMNSLMTACRWPTAVQLDRSDVRRLPRGQVLRGEVRGDQLSGRLRLHQQPGLRVGVEQGRQPLDVDVVGMLVGHHDRVEVGEVLEGRRECTGVDQDPLVAGLDEDAGVAEMSDPHADKLRQQLGGASAA